MSVNGAEAIRKGHELNIASLEAYLRSSVPSFGGKLETVLQFKSGQSNPTFYLKDNAGREYVLRKKPSGNILPSAVREHMFQPGASTQNRGAVFQAFCSHCLFY